MGQNSILGSNESYSFYSTILLFGFGEYEREVLASCVKNMALFDRLKGRNAKIQIYDTDQITDIYGIPYFMAFINFKNVSLEDKGSIFEFFDENEEPISDELIDEGFTQDDFATPTIYVSNCKDEAYKKIPHCVRLKDNMFENKENLRLSILSCMKDIEGLGTASTNSIRIYRVLLEYKCLMHGGVLTREKLSNLVYPDTISKSMYYRDMSIIKEIEYGNIVYDRNLKGYKLINKK